jgi:xanthine dehydrogenase iron-sulfur cluster and FAD-binding subunit A
MPLYSLTINKNKYEVEAEPDMPLIWVLRDIPNLTGTKYGCGVNTSGACTILGKSGLSGEVGIPTVAPALFNALTAAGYRARNLPLKNEGFVWV